MTKQQARYVLSWLWSVFARFLLSLGMIILGMLEWCTGFMRARCQPVMSILQLHGRDPAGAGTLSLVAEMPVPAAAAFIAVGMPSVIPCWAEYDHHHSCRARAPPWRLAAVHRSLE